MDLLIHRSRSIPETVLPKRLHHRTSHVVNQAGLCSTRVRKLVKADIKRATAVAAVAENAAKDESVTEEDVELTGDALALSRSFLIACDDSEESVKGAELIFDTMIKEGDTVHFVHVLHDDRGYATSIDAMYSAEPAAASTLGGGLMAYRSHLEADGAEMMRRQYGKFTERSIRAQFHLPVINGPESCADTGTVLCDLASSLHVDVLAMVTPHRGSLNEFGSVGHHCYHHVQIPMLAVPVKSLRAQTEMKNTALIVAKDSQEASTIKEWVDSWSPVFKDMSKEQLLLGEAYDAPNAVDTICTKMKMTGPRITVILSQADVDFKDEILHPTFAAGFCSKSVSPVLILPRTRRSTHSDPPVGGWEMRTDSEQALLTA